MAQPNTTQIRRLLESDYPNLQWTLDKGELDLVALNYQTIDLISRPRPTPRQSERCAAS